MALPRIVRLAKSWTPDPDDPFGEDKRRLIRFLLDNNITAMNPRPIGWILDNCTLERHYSREAFQHQLLGPLRRDPRVFVGTSSAGLFLVTSPEDADVTLGFYTARVRAELYHARNLRRLAKRTKLMKGYAAEIPDNKDRATIYVDESGSPDIHDHTPPVFIVAAVVVESRQELAGLEQRFKNAFSAIGRPEEHELKTAGLSVRKHARVLRELSLLEYQWAAACFDKPNLTTAGFADPLTLYRYSFQFLIGELLTVSWQADLVLDQNSTDIVQQELEAYLRRQNSGLPVSRLGSVKFSDSSKTRLVQLADLVAGAVRRFMAGERHPLLEIEDKMISVQFWPPRHGASIL
jgi:hypothetical protein